MPVEEVVWKAPEHTIAKHKILRGYLEAWAPIMSRLDGPPPLYIDAFAGPGVYKGGQDGSPLVALKAILNHSREFPDPIRMNFIEFREDRFHRLKSEISKIEIPPAAPVMIERLLRCSCEEGIRNIIQVEAKAHGEFCKALVFLDQFGYSQAPMELIQRVMSGKSCEIFIYLDYQRMNHTLGDPAKARALTRAFGSDVWREALEFEGSERASLLRELYKKALEQAGAEYAWHFEMRGADNRLISWLFFCTTNDRGLEEMKKAMSKLDLTGNFRFSDRDVMQFSLLAEIFDDKWLAGELVQQFDRQTRTLGEIRKYVLSETPSVNYRSALVRLEREQRLRVRDAPKARRRFTFNMEPTTRIDFSIVPWGQSNLF